MNTYWIKIILILTALIVALIILKPHQAKAQVVVGVGVPTSEYQQCIDTCLAYNGYDINTYHFCQNECYYQPPVVVIGGGWFGGHFYPRGHFDRGHDYHGHDRHDGDRGHDHDRR